MGGGECEVGGMRREGGKGGLLNKGGSSGEGEKKRMVLK